jgi:hypothetical protein
MHGLTPAINGTIEVVDSSISYNARLRQIFKNPLEI